MKSEMLVKNLQSVLEISFYSLATKNSKRNKKEPKGTKGTKRNQKEPKGTKTNQINQNKPK